MTSQPTIIDVPTRAGYDRWSEIYDGGDNPLVTLEHDLFPGLLENISGLQIADIGCGTGRNAIPLAKAGAQITGLDFSSGMVAKARAKDGWDAVHFIHANLETRFPLRDEQFDRVICCLVLDHIRNLNLFFGELRRICRKSGFVVATVMHPAMLLRGTRANFTDPATGQKISPASVPNQITDYLMAAHRAGLSIDHLSEHLVTESLVARSPRAQKYLGWPLLLLMRFRP
ncbi:MAG: class I SAM-dependent methyltransferase [Candidatus Ozemobacteraceae bacterium]